MALSWSFKASLSFTKASGAFFWIVDSLVLNQSARIIADVEDGPAFHGMNDIAWVTHRFLYCLHLAGYLKKMRAVTVLPSASSAPFNGVAVTGA